VTDLARRRPASGVHVPAEQEPGADPDAHPHHDEPVPFRSDRPVLRQRGSVGAVGDPRRVAGPLGQDLGERQVVPIEVGGLDHDAVGSDEPRGPDTDPGNRCGRASREIARESHDGVEEVVAGEPGIRERLPREDRPGEVAQGPDDRWRPDVDSDDGPCGGIDTQQGRWLPPIGAPRSEFDDQSRAHQFRDKARHRGAGQPRGSGQFGTAEGDPGGDIAEDPSQVRATAVGGPAPVVGQRTEDAPWCSHEPDPSAPAAGATPACVMEPNEPTRRIESDLDARADRDLPKGRRCRP
jgi:hypothetical protein